MKKSINMKSSFFTLCMAAALFAVVGLGSARAQEVVVDGSTAGGFSGGCGEGGSTDGLTYVPSNFGGMTKNGVLELNTANNNLGTIIIDTSARNPCGSFNMDVVFNLPSGFLSNPVSANASVFGYLYPGEGEGSGLDGQVFITSGGGQSTSFNNSGGAGTFFVAIDDACFNISNSVATPTSCSESDGPIGFGKLRRSRNSGALAARNGRSGDKGQFSLLKAKGSPLASMSTVSYRNQNPIVINLTLTGKVNFILKQGQSLGLACTYGQGYYKNKAGAIPESVALIVDEVPTGASVPFKMRLGDIAYTRSQLIEIMRAPTKGNGLFSLAQQLIAAKRNAARGAVPSQIALAINDADDLIGPNRLAGGTPIGSMSPKFTSALNDLLTRYNEGKIAGAPACR